MGLDRESDMKLKTTGGNRPLSAFLMDVDNTLIDIKRRDHQSFCDTAAEMGFPTLEFEEFAEMRVSGDLSREIGAVLLSRGGDPERLNDFLQARHSRLDRPELFQLDTLFPGTTQVLYRISESGIPIVAATLRHEVKLLEMELTRLGIRDAFSGILTAGDIREQANRPYEPEYDSLCYYKGLVLEEATKRFGLIPRETAFVSDTEFDIKAGIKLGLITVAVESGYGENDRLRSMADLCLPSVAELSDVLMFRN